MEEINFMLIQFKFDSNLFSILAIANSHQSWIDFKPINHDH
jgi:hypothetical protein